MKSNLDAKMEQQFSLWERVLYICYGIVFTLLAHAIIKAHENTVLADALFFIKQNTEVTNSSALAPYDYHMDSIIFSPWRLLLLMVVELFILICAGILSFRPVWRNISLAKRLDLIFGYFLAVWVGLFSLGAQNPLDIGNGYNFFVISYILILVLGYWRLRHKRERAEEVFP